MPLQTSGKISIGDIRTQLGLSGQLSMTAAAVRTLCEVASGTIRLSNAYGKPSAPTYTITPNLASVNEGGQAGFTVTTTNVANGTVLYYSVPLTVTVSGFDFVTNGGGSVTINSNTGTFNIHFAADELTEGAEQFYVILATTPGGVEIARSSTVTVNDTSTTPAGPTYQITPNLASVNEGGQIAFTVTTTNVANGTILYWTIPLSGGVTASDFTATTNGQVTINNNTGSVTQIGINADNFTDSDSFYFILMATNGGAEISRSGTITINDTSTTPAGPTWTVGGAGHTVLPGQTDYFPITTTNIANGTQMYWKLDYAGTAGVHGPFVYDFFTNYQGIAGIQNNGGAIGLTSLITPGNNRSGLHNFRLYLYDNNAFIGTNSYTDFGINFGAAVVEPTYTPVLSTTSMNEGGSVTYTVNTTDVANGTKVYAYVLSINSEITLNRLSPATISSSHELTINNNAASFVLGITADSTTGTGGNITIGLKNSSATYITQWPSVTINDTSTTPALPRTYTLTADKTAVDEGGTVTFTLTTTNVPDGSAYDFYVSGLVGDITAADFTYTNNMTVYGGTATRIVTVSADTVTEGSEAFRGIIAGLGVGQLAQSPMVTINDTSLTPVVYPAYGIYVTEWCSGTTLVKQYHNGIGGYYTSDTVNSATCGYVAVVPGSAIITTTGWYALPATSGTTIRAYAFGGGGGGGGGNNRGNYVYTAGGGGASGVGVWGDITVTPGQDIWITIGGGGGGGGQGDGPYAAASAGGGGGATSVIEGGIDRVLAPGGKGGSASTASSLVASIVYTPGGTAGGVAWPNGPDRIGTLFNSGNPGGDGATTNSEYGGGQTDKWGNVIPGTVMPSFGLGGHGGTGIDLVGSNAYAGLGGIGDIGSPNRYATTGGQNAGGGGGGGINASTLAAGTDGAPGGSGLVMLTWGN